MCVSECVWCLRVRECCCKESSEQIGLFSGEWAGEDAGPREATPAGCRRRLVRSGGDGGTMGETA